MSVKMCFLFSYKQYLLTENEVSLSQIIVLKLFSYGFEYINFSFYGESKTASNFKFRLK